MQITHDDFEMAVKAKLLLEHSLQEYNSIPEENLKPRHKRALIHSYKVATRMVGIEPDSEVTHEGIVSYTLTLAFDTIVDTVRKLIVSLERLAMRYLSTAGRRLSTIKSQRRDFNSAKRLLDEQSRKVGPFPITPELVALLKTNLTTVENIDVTDIGATIRNMYDGRMIDAVSDRIHIIMEKVGKVDTLDLNQLKQELVSERILLIGEILSLFGINEGEKNRIKGAEIHTGLSVIGHNVIEITADTESAMQAPTIKTYIHPDTIKLFKRTRPIFPETEADKVFNSLGESIEDTLKAVVERTTLFTSPKKLAVTAKEVADKLEEIRNNKKIEAHRREFVDELITTVAEYLKLNRDFVSTINGLMVAQSTAFIHLVNRYNGEA